MKVEVMNEAGYTEALHGLSLSYSIDYFRAVDVANKLASQEGGHNKFLESICIWIDITAPRYWWQQFDTYRVGMTKQSESSMHNFSKRTITAEDFEDPLSPAYLEDLNAAIRAKDFGYFKNHLPEGFLQRRIICTNYKTLRNIIRQRLTHRLPQWQTFIQEVYRQCKHHQFLDDLIPNP